MKISPVSVYHKLLNFFLIKIFLLFALYNAQVIYVGM